MKTIKEIMEYDFEELKDMILINGKIIVKFQNTKDKELNTCKD